MGQHYLNPESAQGPANHDTPSLHSVEEFLSPFNHYIVAEKSLQIQCAKLAHELLTSIENRTDLPSSGVSDLTTLTGYFKQLQAKAVHLNGLQRQVTHYKESIDKLREDLNSPDNNLNLSQFKSKVNALYRAVGPVGISVNTALKEAENLRNDADKVRSRIQQQYF